MGVTFGIYIGRMKVMKMRGKILTGIVTAALFCILFAVNTFAGDDVAIDATNFPDEIFRTYVSDNFDTNGDGILQGSEADGVTDIDVSQKNITSLKGIEYFTYLTKLYCYNNKLTSLDVSKNTALRTLRCYFNELSSLDVTKNIALKEYQFSFANMLKYNEEHPDARLMPYIVFDTGNINSRLPYSKKDKKNISVEFVNVPLEQAYKDGRLEQLAAEDGLYNDKDPEVTPEQIAEAVKKAAIESGVTR